MLIRESENYLHNNPKNNVDVEEIEGDE